MKKLFTLTMLALLSVGGVNAQNQLRKSWDFREGFSQKTVNALKADQEEFGTGKYWRNFESDATKADQQHFWNASTAIKNSDGYACTHGNGKETVIPELDGLKLNLTAAKKFVITYDGAQTENTYDGGGLAVGEMVPHGKSYIWLNGKNESFAFKAEVGQTIKIAVESHAVNATKLGEARGISLTASGGTLKAKFEGSPVPTYYTEYEWDLEGDKGNVAELTIKSTNGCHIYYIIVGDGVNPEVPKTKVAYITDGDATGETVYTKLAADDELSVTPVAGNSVTTDALSNYDIAVISSTLSATSPAVAALKEKMPFLPVLNLNADLYEAWGYGTPTAVEGFGVVKDLKNLLLQDVDVTTEGEGEDAFSYVDLTTASDIKAIQLGAYFKGDPMPLVDGNNGELAVAHTHNINHNGYIYLPYAADATEGLYKMIVNAVSMLKDSKSAVEKASAPKISLEYKNLNTNITLAMASSNYAKPHIYYTLDGTDPTTSSEEYTDVLNVTEAKTIKAVAIAEGYLLSDVASAEVAIYEQPATPSITKNFEDGVTNVTLASATEGVDIWYNYTATNDTTQSMKYTEPIAIKAPTDLTAFAVAGGEVFSELATERVVVKDAVVRIDKTGAQFDANATDWQNGSGSTIYYFTWGKTSKTIYDDTQDPVGLNDNSEPIFPEREYEVYNPGNGWEVMSKGQVMTYQVLSVGKDPGNDGGYNPETAGDIIAYALITANDIQFGGKVSGEPCTGAIQSTEKYQGPFNVATIIGTASGGDNVGRIQLQVSTDSLTWTSVGNTMNTSTIKRLWKTYTQSYEGTDAVYIRLIQDGGGAGAQIYNIYVLNEGEQSKAKKAEYDAEYQEYQTGISNVKSTTKAIEGIYNLSGVRQRTLQRGLNIVVASDGTVKKVVVK